MEIHHFNNKLSKYENYFLDIPQDIHKSIFNFIIDDVANSMYNEYLWVEILNYIGNNSLGDLDSLIDIVNNHIFDDSKSLISYDDLNRLGFYWEKLTRNERQIYRKRYMLNDETVDIESFSIYLVDIIDEWIASSNYNSKKLYTLNNILINKYNKLIQEDTELSDIEKKKFTYKLYIS